MPNLWVFAISICLIIPFIDTIRYQIELFSSDDKSVTKQLWVLLHLVFVLLGLIVIGFFLVTTVNKYRIPIDLFEQLQNDIDKNIQYKDSSSQQVNVDNYVYAMKNACSQVTKNLQQLDAAFPPIYQG